LQQFENLSETLPQFRFELVEGQNKQRNERNPDLSKDGVSTRSEEGFDLQVLLDPFEEKFDLPAVMIDIADRFRDKVADIPDLFRLFPPLYQAVTRLRW
jgi:hypothetical protein